MQSSKQTAAIGRQQRSRDMNTAGDNPPPNLLAASFEPTMLNWENSESEQSSVMLLDHTDNTDSGSSLIQLLTDSGSELEFSIEEGYNALSTSSVGTPYYNTLLGTWEEDSLYDDAYCDSSSSPLYLLDSSPLLGSPDTLSMLSPPLRFSTPQRSDTSFIHQLLQRHCCSQRCLAHLSAVEVERSRKWFDSRDRTRQNQFLLDSYHISQTGRASNHTRTAFLEGKQLCKKAYISVLGISSQRFDRLYREFCEGGMHYIRKPTPRNETSKVCPSVI